VGVKTLQNTIQYLLNEILLDYSFQIKFTLWWILSVLAVFQVTSSKNLVESIIINVELCVPVAVFQKRLFFIYE